LRQGLAPTKLGWGSPYVGRNAHRGETKCVVFFCLGFRERLRWAPSEGTPEGMAFGQRPIFAGWEILPGIHAEFSGYS